MRGSEVTRERSTTQSRERESYADEDAERRLLGGVLNGDAGALILLKELDAAVFVGPERAEAWRVSCELVDRGDSPDLVLVNAELRRRGWPHAAYELAVSFDAFVEAINRDALPQISRELEYFAAMRALRWALGSAWAAVVDGSLPIEERLGPVELVGAAFAAAREALGAVRGLRQ